MNDRSLIEQDHDSTEQYWMDDRSWLNNYLVSPMLEDRDLNRFIVYINKNPILVSILTFIIGGIAFFIVGTVLL
jgi:hypothetical protein